MMGTFWNESIRDGVLVFLYGSIGLGLLMMLWRKARRSVAAWIRNLVSKELQIRVLTLYLVLLMFGFLCVVVGHFLFDELPFPHVLLILLFISGLLCAGLAWRGKRLEKRRDIQTRDDECVGEGTLPRTFEELFPGRWVNNYTLKKKGNTRGKEDFVVKDGNHYCRNGTHKFNLEDLDFLPESKVCFVKVSLDGKFRLENHLTRDPSGKKMTGVEMCGGETENLVAYTMIGP